MYKKNSGTLSEIYLNRVIQWRNEYVNMRGFKSVISVRNTYNNIEDSTVQTLLDACKRNAPIFHIYFKEKVRILGVRNFIDTIFMPQYRQMKPIKKELRLVGLNLKY